MGRAAATAGARAIIAAGTGVHRAHQLKTRGIDAAGVDAGNRDLAILHRLTQRLKHGTWKLRQLVQEQHAVMRLGDLSGHGISSAADERRGRRGVVRRRKRPLLHQPARKTVRDRVDDGGFQRLALRHVRQNAGQAARQHGLARACGADEQQVVPARCRDLQRAPRRQLSADARHIHLGRHICILRTIGRGDKRLQAAAARKVGCGLPKGLDG